MDSTPIVLPIQLTPAQVRPLAYRIISKKHGLNLKSPALDVLSKFLGHHFGADWRSQRAEKSLDEISKRWKEEDRGIFVDGPPLAQVIKDFLNAESATQNPNTASQEFDWKQYFKVVNTNDQVRLVYDRNKKNFTLPTHLEQGSNVPNIFGDASSLTSVFTSRYNVLKDKMYRNDMFQPSSLASSEGIHLGDLDRRPYTISPVKNMLGRSIGTEFFLFGLLEKQEDGPWTIYDSTASIPLYFTEDTSFHPDHYYTNGCFVICHGHFMGEYLQVVTLGHPLPERREFSQASYGNIDFYGLNTGRTTRRNSSRIERIDQSLQQILEVEEGKMSHNKIVILGTDIYLDKIPVLDALKRTLMELEKNPPVAIILPGSFISAPMQPHMATNNDGRNAAQLYRDGMNSLADIFQQCPDLSAKTKIIFIPGPNDPWHSTSSSNVLPYNRIPSVFTGRVDRAIKDVEWATNPTRLCYLSQEIYIYRGNTGDMLRKYSLDTDAYVMTTSQNDLDNDTPSNAISEGANTVSSVAFDNDHIEEREADRAGVATMVENNDFALPALTKSTATNDANEFKRVLCTLLDQCHVSPFALAKSPVIWEFDQAISVAQWPTCFVLLDPTTPAAKQVYEGCHVMNPGQFYYNNKANWLEYWPSSGNHRFCDLN